MRPRRAFTLLELVIAICLIGFLTALAAKRLLALRVEAERAAVGQVLGGLRAAVSLEMLSLVIADRDEELARLPGSNPMRHVLEPPGTYLGEFDGPDPDRVDPGHWYFDRRLGMLIYRVRYGDHFSTELSGPPRVRFRVDLDYDDRNGNGRFDPDVDGVGGARVRAAEPYAWSIELDRARDSRDVSTHGP